MDITPQQKIKNLYETIQDCRVLSVVINGQPPSKKNSKQIIHVRGRMIIIPSKGHKDWHDQSLYPLISLKNALPSVLIPKLVLCTLYSKDKRKWDISNKWESVGDLLVDAGIIEDDNYDFISKLLIVYGGVDKENPRTELDLFY